ncbi:NAD(P)/FAD-dependent oxidoreductase [Salinispora oceanensis]|uniref:NAD(P)/FAD-dependent oxidoreductase n=1 Tax=Salinispora oceanensis TaxID=1050199 RepID=UPI000370F3CD|nr:FAD-dependent oxidoreductase [Salinispora oceanensis]
MADIDVAIVGAGIIGCVTAWQLVARVPGSRVVVLDRDIIASGATRRSAGLHFPRGGSEQVRRMSAYSQQYYERLARSWTGMPIHPVPMVVLTADPVRLHESYLAEAGLRRTALPSFVRLSDGIEAWRGDGCQYADVAALTQQLAAKLRGSVQFYEGTRVTQLTPDPDGVTVSLGTGADLRAGQVLLAPGPWLADPAWSYLTAPLGARVKKVVALHIEQAPSIDDDVVVFEDQDAFLLPLFERGHWLFSYTCREWDVRPDELTTGLSARNLDEALTYLRRHAPALAGRCVGGRVFCDAYSGDGEPRVRYLDPDRRLVFAGAANGSGYRLAPAIARAACGLLDVSTRQGAFRDHQHL